MNKKLYLVGGTSYFDYVNWILPLGFELTKQLEESDLIVGAGGEDWGPEYYNEPYHPTTYTSDSRNQYEWEIFNKAIKLNIPLVGICRSAQGASVISGGKLCQHVRHPSSHSIKTFDDKIFKVTSSHHQMMFPFNLPDEDYKIIGFTENLSPFHEGGNQEEMNPPVEPEIVYFRKTRFLGIQNHPEWMDLNSENVKYCQGLVLDLLNNKL